MPLYEYHTYDPESGRRIMLEHPEHLTASEFAERVSSAEVAAMSAWLEEEYPRLRANDQKRLHDLIQARTERAAAGVSPEIGHPVYGDAGAIDVMIEYYEASLNEAVTARYSDLVEKVIETLESDGFSQVTGVAVVARADMARITGIGQCRCGQKYLIGSRRGRRDADVYHTCLLGDAGASATSGQEEQ